MLSKIDTTKILIHLNNNIYLNYDNIISVFDANNIVNTNWFKSKKLVYSQKDKIPKSYIYCKNDFIVATSIDVNYLKNRIEEVTNSFYDNNLFKF